MNKLYTFLKKCFNIKIILILNILLLVLFIFLINKYNHYFNYNNCIFIFFLNLQYFKTNYTFIFFTFNLFYFILFILIINKKIRKSFLFFIKNFKKLRFKKNFKLIVNCLMYFFLFLINTSPVKLLQYDFTDTAIIEIFLIYYWIWFFLIYFVNVKHFCNINKIESDYIIMVKKTRQKIIATLYIIIYIFCNYFYNILDKFLFPINNITFLKLYLGYFTNIFGNFDIIVLVCMYVILLLILTLLFFVKVMCIVNILTGRLSTLFFGDCLYKRYDKCWSTLYFFYIFKKNFVEIDECDYTLFQKIFNPTSWLNFKTNVYNYGFELKSYLIQHYKNSLIFFFLCIMIIIFIIINK